jgi:hypothetical protein
MATKAVFAQDSAASSKKRKTLVWVLFMSVRVSRRLPNDDRSLYVGRH